MQLTLPTPLPSTGPAVAVATGELQLKEPPGADQAGTWPRLAP